MTIVNRLDDLTQAATLLEAADILSEVAEHSDSIERTKRAVLPILVDHPLDFNHVLPAIDLTPNVASNPKKRAILPILVDHYLDSNHVLPAIDLTPIVASNPQKQAVFPVGEIPKTKVKMPQIMKNLLAERRNDLPTALSKISSGSKKERTVSLPSSPSPEPTDLDKKRKKITDWFIQAGAGKTGNELLDVALEARTKFFNLKINYPLSGLVALIKNKKPDEGKDREQEL